MATILCVEDNSDNRLLLRRVLIAEGHKVLEAANAGEVMKILTHQIPDLILMDINLPEVDGYTLTARLKAKPEMSRTPIVALTANVMRGDREKTLQAGCDGYIQKPVDVDDLPRMIKRYLREVNRA
jgi:two-component system, cell cycle response regulator DivK